MQVTATAFTIAEYCEQMQNRSIVTNPEYQRSPKVWPPAARSYLIDTILHGYPMPKLSLFQITDLKSRRTIKEIVDGQQRSRAILDFANDDLRVSGRSDFSGKKFSQLDPEDQQRFLEYQVTTDIFVGATASEIRQVFRRINSYNVPLNPQEKRHAVFQGEFKWFIVELTEQYAQTLKDIGVFKESQLSRMADAVLFSELVLAYRKGIQHASEPKLDELYRTLESEFLEGDEMKERIDRVFSVLLKWKPIHSTVLMKPYNFYTLFLATWNRLAPVPSLEALVAGETGAIKDFKHDVVLSNLTTLAAALDEGVDTHANLGQFIEACSKATNRREPRITRFRFYFRALGDHLI